MSFKYDKDNLYIEVNQAKAKDIKLSKYTITEKLANGNNGKIKKPLKKPKEIDKIGTVRVPLRKPKGMK